MDRWVPLICCLHFFCKFFEIILVFQESFVACLRNQKSSKCAFLSLEAERKLKVDTLSVKNLKLKN